MKVKQKPLSFSLCQDNHAYIDTEWQVNHRSRSHWMDDLVTHLRLKKEASTTVKAPANKRKKLTYPDNLDEQFLLLWDAKDKKGQKQKAYDIYRKMSAGQTNEILEGFTLILITDINKKKHEPGYPERHLTSYLNGKFWEE